MVVGVVVDIAHSFLTCCWCICILSLFLLEILASEYFRVVFVVVFIVVMSEYRFVRYLLRLQLFLYYDFVLLPLYSAV